MGEQRHQHASKSRRSRNEMTAGEFVKPRVVAQTLATIAMYMLSGQPAVHIFISAITRVATNVVMSSNIRLTRSSVAVGGGTDRNADKLRRFGFRGRRRRAVLLHPAREVREQQPPRRTRSLVRVVRCCPSKCDVDVEPTFEHRLLDHIEQRQFAEVDVGGLQPQNDKSLQRTGPQ